MTFRSSQSQGTHRIWTQNTLDLAKLPPPTLSAAEPLVLLLLL